MLSPLNFFKFNINKFVNKTLLKNLVLVFSPSFSPAAFLIQNKAFCGENEQENRKKKEEEREKEKEEEREREREREKKKSVDACVCRVRD